MISLYKLSAIFFSVAVIVFVIGLLIIRMGSTDEADKDGPLVWFGNLFVESLWLTGICGLLVTVSLVLLLYAWWKG